MYIVKFKIKKGIEEEEKPKLKQIIKQNNKTPQLLKYFSGTDTNVDLCIKTIKEEKSPKKKKKLKEKIIFDANNINES